jgi:ATP-dependent RNA helicase SUPV3L1/SUV3
MQIRTAPVGERHRLVAVLGPTNTGKTYLAMDRMLGFESGMIGFPLRLLARENYDRAIRIKGPRTVALITGEEKIVPPDARYFLCTVESMPVTRRVAFLGVDEIQMCADPDRGHIFTDRLLHARGSLETMFMGAETIKPLLRRLVPGAEFVSQPRFSKLQHNGRCKVSRLPPRSAVVAFSAADVYVIAELIRRQRGGAAVVLGALSPRTRNAQVAMYQDGEVDYLVATDAIGMGLNMNVDHVAFAATRKFDGRVPRTLTPSELAQIAGRAGRHMKDGTFGTTTDIGAFDPEVAERIENHRFDPLRAVFWRNSGLKFSSVALLKASLSRPPARPELVKAREADDEIALSLLTKDPGITDLARGPDAVRLLWEICKIPDFGKVMSDAHARLLGQIYRYLAGSTGRDGRLPTDWVARQVDRINRVDGDIEALMQRIANIRTWTYVSYHGDWLEDAAHWQERTRGIEDRLSDALHERLIQRFVDRRTALLVGRMKERRDLFAAVNADDEVLVEGHFVGMLKGFRFVVDPVGGSVAGPGETGAGKAVTAAALRALRSEIMQRMTRLEKDGDKAFALTDDGYVGWRGVPVARLAASGDVFRPTIEPFASDLLEADPRERIRRRLVRWLEGHLQARLAPLFQARRAELSGAARGLVFQVAEALGSLPRGQAFTQIAALSTNDRKALRALGLRIGRESVYFPPLLKPHAVALRGLLWAVHRGTERPELPAPGRMSVPLAADVPRAFYEAVGYRPLGPLAVRVDIVERLAARAFSLSRQGEFAVVPELLTLVGCGGEDMAGVLSALGYLAIVGDTAVTFRPAKRGKGNGQIRSRSRNRNDRADADSPFAELRALRSSR